MPYSDTIKPGCICQRTSNVYTQSTYIYTQSKWVAVMSPCYVCRILRSACYELHCAEDPIKISGNHHLSYISGCLKFFIPLIIYWGDIKFFIPLIIYTWREAIISENVLYNYKYAGCEQLLNIYNLQIPYSSLYLVENFHGKKTSS